MRKGIVYLYDVKAGIISEDSDGIFRFEYDKEYALRKDALPVSSAMPITASIYESDRLFPFFDGLIPEGWLLDVALRNTDISELDRFSLLLLCCMDCIGAVSVIPLKEDGDE